MVPGRRTRVVNIRFDPYTVYIGRAGKGKPGYFGNPFILPKESMRVKILFAYEEWFYKRIEEDLEFKERVLNLKGEILGCFCKPNLCHGDIIVDYLEHEVR